MTAVVNSLVLAAVLYAPRLAAPQPSSDDVARACFYSGPLGLTSPAVRVISLEALTSPVVCVVGIEVLAILAPAFSLCLLKAKLRKKVRGVARKLARENAQNYQREIVEKSVGKMDEKSRRQTIYKPTIEITEESERLLTQISERETTQKSGKEMKSKGEIFETSTREISKEKELYTVASVGFKQTISYGYIKNSIKSPKRRPIPPFHERFNCSAFHDIVSLLLIACFRLGCFISCPGAYELHAYSLIIASCILVVKCIIGLLLLLFLKIKFFVS